MTVEATSVEPLFALDVGTRKVCGLLVRAGTDGAGHRVQHWSVREHPGRAMLDGQVHVIASAARSISFSTARARAQTVLSFTSSATAFTASK